MVKVGFIVEGGCERILLRHASFQSFIRHLGIELIGDVINIDGKGNLKSSSKRMQGQVQILRDLGADYIVVLRDMDDAPTLTIVKQEVYQTSDVKICIAVKEIEAWFLAASLTMSSLFNTDFYFDKPEDELKPFDVLKRLRLQFTGSGISDKKIFAQRALNHGFTIEQAALHPNCPSARYFLTTLQTLASAN